MADKKELAFLNRDHIISLVTHNGEITVTTTPGDKITIPRLTLLWKSSSMI